MIDQEIYLGNKLIEKWMQDNAGAGMVYCKVACTSAKRNFNEDWNLLMQAINKIEDDENFAFNIFQKEAWAADDNYRLTAQGKRIAKK